MTSASGASDALTARVPVAYAYRHADLPDDIDASTFEGRLGHCYTLAAHVHANLYMRGWKDITLVHGIIGASGNPHAWLEFRLDGKRYVYDPTLDGIIPHDFYRDEWRCRVWSRYTIQQASALITAEKSFGPWGANDARYDKRVEAMERLKAEGRFPPPPDMDKVPMLRAAEPGAEPMIPFSIQG